MRGNGDDRSHGPRKRISGFSVAFLLIGLIALGLGTILGMPELRKEIATIRVQTGAAYDVLRTQIDTATRQLDSTQAILTVAQATLVAVQTKIAGYTPSPTPRPTSTPTPLPTDTPTPTPLPLISALGAAHGDYVYSRELVGWGRATFDLAEVVSLGLSNVWERYFNMKEPERSEWQCALDVWTHYIVNANCWELNHDPGTTDTYYIIPRQALLSIDELGKLQKFWKLASPVVMRGAAKKWVEEMLGDLFWRVHFVDLRLSEIQSDIDQGLEILYRYGETTSLLVRCKSYGYEPLLYVQVVSVILQGKPCEDYQLWGRFRAWLALQPPKTRQWSRGLFALLGLRSGNDLEDETLESLYLSMNQLELRRQLLAIPAPEKQ